MPHTGLLLMALLTWSVAPHRAGAGGEPTPVHRRSAAPGSAARRRPQPAVIVGDWQPRPVAMHRDEPASPNPPGKPSCCSSSGSSPSRKELHVEGNRHR